nr:hypothetical protein [Oxalobacteraceae bacterium]
MKSKIALIVCLSLGLSTIQVANSPVYSEICQGPAAYPPDLPDCLDPVVAAQQAAAAKAAQDAVAAQAAAEAAAELAAAEAAAAKAAADKLAADELAKKILEGNLAEAAKIAEDAAKAAQKLFELREIERIKAEDALKLRRVADEIAADNLRQAQEKLEEQRILSLVIINNARIEAEKLEKIALEKKAEADRIRLLLAAEISALNQALAEKEANLKAIERAADLSKALADSAYEDYIKAGGEPIAIRSSALRISEESIKYLPEKKINLLTENRFESYLSANSSLIPFTLEISELKAAYLAALDRANEDKQLKISANTEFNKVKTNLESVNSQITVANNEWIEAAKLRNAKVNVIEIEIKKQIEAEDKLNKAKTDLLAAIAATKAAELELSRREIAELVAKETAESMKTASSTLLSITADSSNSSNLATQALAAFQNAAAASSNAAKAAADAAAAAERESAAAAAAIRAR